MFPRMRMAALVVAVTLVVSGLALAHDDDDDNGYYRGNVAQARQYGYQNGYRDGFRHGREDRFRRGGYDFRSEDLEHSSRGYAQWMGPFGQFKKGYRDGYRRGYEAGFYRSGYFRRGDGDGDADDRIFDRDDYGYGRPRFGGNVGYNFGYQDGSTVAREDIAKGKPYNPNPRGRYDDRDHGYRGEYGNKDNYKAQYAAGYRAGYQSVFGNRY